MWYKVFKHKITIENITVDSFGIRAYKEDELVCELFDVSTNYYALVDLVTSLNENQVDIIHLDSILEDFYLDNV